MNCCGLTASKERRVPSRMAEWMRASRCLAQNVPAGPAASSLPPDRATRQASTEPSATSRASAERTSPALPVPMEAESSSALTGPRISRWPLAAATRASSLDQAAGWRDGLQAVVGIETGLRAKRARRLPAFDRHPSRDRTRELEPHGSPGEASASIHFVHSGRGGASTSEQSRSCSSSALRSSGRACSITAATVAGSRAARSRASSGSPRRVVDSPRAPLLQRGVVEEGVGAAVQDLLGEHRGDDRVHAVRHDLAGPQPDEHRGEAGEVHRLGATVVEGLAHHRMRGDLDRARDVLLAGCEGGKDRRHQIVRLHALDRRRDAAAPPVAGGDERTGQVPPPAGAEHRRGEHGLDQRVAHRRRERGTRGPPPGGRSAAGRARARRRRRWRPPAARSRTSCRSACAGQGRGHG